MSPKKDNQELSSGPDVTVDIPHEQNQPAPVTAPPLPQLEPLPVRPINITDNAPLSTPAVPAIPPELSNEFYEHEGRRWPVILIYIVLAFAVALLVVFAGRWVYQKVSNDKPQPTLPAGNNQSQTPPPPPTEQTPANIPAPAASQNQTSQNSPLPNSGPGDVIVLFVGTAIVVGGLHFLYNLRKQN